MPKVNRINRTKGYYTELFDPIFKKSGILKPILTG
jgi:hypothetical protein